jgi:twitching motility protein PilT
MDFMALLHFAVENDASDIHVQSGLPPCLRIGGILRSTSEPPLADEEVRNFITSIAPQRFRENVDDRMAAGMDFSYAIEGLTRFRCSA